MNLDSKMVENITKQTYIEQNQKLRFFARVDITTKLKIIQHQKQFFHKLKGAYMDVDNAILTLGSLILAINFVTKGLDIANLNAIKLRGKNNKAKIKRQKLLGYWAIVRTLRLEQALSFRDISIYFKKYHKLEVSYSTIYGLWTELETTSTNQEEN